MELNGRVCRKREKKYGSPQQESRLEGSAAWRVAYCLWTSPPVRSQSVGLGSDNTLRMTSRQIQGRTGGGQGVPVTVNRPKPSFVSFCFPALAPTDVSFFLHYDLAPLQEHRLHSTPSPHCGLPGASPPLHLLTPLPTS